jgi:hypothetical protein
MISDLDYLKGYYYGLMNGNKPSFVHLRPKAWLDGINDAVGDYQLMTVESYNKRIRKALRELEAAKLDE